MGGFNRAQMTGFGSRQNELPGHSGQCARVGGGERGREGGAQLLQVRVAQKSRRQSPAQLVPISEAAAHEGKRVSNP